MNIKQKTEYIKKDNEFKITTFEPDYKRDFKGVWIPKEIWLDKNLSFLEKGLLIEIDSLDNQDGCFASNSYFASFFGISEINISKHIKKLKELNYIKQTFFDGRKRTLKSNLAMIYQKSYADLSESIRPSYQNRLNRVIENEKYINIVNNKAINKDNELINSEIEDIYLHYPTRDFIQKYSTGKCKKNRQQIKVLLKTRSKEEILQEIDNYINTQKKAKLSIKTFSRFLDEFPDREEKPKVDILKLSDAEAIKYINENYK